MANASESQTQRDLHAHHSMAGSYVWNGKVKLNVSLNLDKFKLGSDVQKIAKELVDAKYDCMDYDMYKNNCANFAKDFVKLDL